MHILHDPLDFVTEIQSGTCEYHKRQPWDMAFAGCTCWSSYSQRRATPEERAENVKRHEEEMERRRKRMEAYDRGEIK